MSVWRYLTTLFRPDSAVAKHYELLREMLLLGKRMFDRVTEPLLDPDKPLPDSDLVYGMDRKLNRLEREMRRQLLTAVAVNPDQDAMTRILLLGLARDAERIGDFAKNIYEVFEHVGPIDPGPYAKFLTEQRAFISDLFDDVWTVFQDADVEAAQHLVARAKILSRRDAAIVDELLVEATCDQPVAVALLTRFLKRIQHHLVNVAKSVAMPADLMHDYDQPPASAK